MSSSAANGSASRSCARQAALTAPPRSGASRRGCSTKWPISWAMVNRRRRSLEAPRSTMAWPSPTGSSAASQTNGSPAVCDDLEVERAHDVTQRDGLARDAGALQQARGLPADVGGRVAHQVPRGEYYHRARTRTPCGVTSAGLAPRRPPATQPMSGSRRATTPPTSSASAMVPAQMPPCAASPARGPARRSSRRRGCRCALTMA